MLSTPEKNAFREDLFRHLDGITVAPVASALKEKGVLDVLLEQDRFSLQELSDRFKANEGYLNVALRMLGSQGWLSYEIDPETNAVWISKNDKSALAFSRADRYRDVVTFITLSEDFHSRSFEKESFSLLSRIFKKYMNGDYSEDDTDGIQQEIAYQITKHIEGVLVGPITVFLGMDGMFHKYFMEASFSADEFHEDPVSFSKILDFFTYLGWFSKKNEHYRFNLIRISIFRQVYSFFFEITRAHNLIG